jgi:hypothetical protein
MLLENSTFVLDIPESMTGLHTIMLNLVAMLDCQLLEPLMTSAIVGVTG